MAELSKALIEKAKKLYDQKELERLGLTPDLVQRENIIKYLALVLKWNDVCGLVSPKDEGTVFIRHFCDSLQPLLLLGFKKDALVLDIGSGGGFPSIPIAIFRPDLNIVLVEQNKKKSSFLEETVSFLGLKNTKVFPSKIEKLSVEENMCDYVMSRAFSSIGKFTVIAKEYCKPDGKMYTFKTKNFDSEICEITENKNTAGIAISEIAEYDLGIGSFQICGLKLVALVKINGL